MFTSIQVIFSIIKPIIVELWLQCELLSYSIIKMKRQINRKAISYVSYVIGYKFMYCYVPWFLHQNTILLLYFYIVYCCVSFNTEFNRSISFDVQVTCTVSIWCQGYIITNKLFTSLSKLRFYSSNFHHTLSSLMLLLKWAF